MTAGEVRSKLAWHYQTAEAEYIAMSAATQKALWMKQLLTSLTNVEKPITI